MFGIILLLHRRAAELSQMRMAGASRKGTGFEAILYFTAIAGMLSF
jgi:hypothetical protein